LAGISRYFILAITGGLALLIMLMLALLLFFRTPTSPASSIAVGTFAVPVGFPSKPNQGRITWPLKKEKLAA
jgi:hypothetical protein